MFKKERNSVLVVKEKSEFRPSLLERVDFGFALFYGGKFGFEFGKRFLKLNSIYTCYIVMILILILYHNMFTYISLKLLLTSLNP